MSAHKMQWGKPVGRSVSQEGIDKKQLLSNMKKVAGKLALKEGRSMDFSLILHSLLSSLASNEFPQSELYWSEGSQSFTGVKKR